MRLHCTGRSEDIIAAELWFMARHFEHKTGCSVYLPQLEKPPSSLTRAGQAALRWGEGVLVNVLSKLTGAA